MAKNDHDIVLVDKNDAPIGTGTKADVHRQGLLHRAFSVFIFNKENKLLLQQRALTKYHSAGLWSNTCCSHPKPKENTLAAAQRRLREEMGFVCDLEEKFNFIYQAVFDNGLTEHEFDHVLFGHYDGSVSPNAEEVEAYRWIDLDELKKDLQENPRGYTEWFKICFNKVLAANNTITS